MFTILPISRKLWNVWGNHKYSPNDRMHGIAFIPNDGVYSRVVWGGGLRIQWVGCGWYEDHRSSSAVMGKSLDCFILRF